jgi:hypothetical protein
MPTLAAHGAVLATAREIDGTVVLCVVVVVGILLFINSSTTAPRFDLSDVWRAADADDGRRRAAGGPADRTAGSAGRGPAAPGRAGGGSDEAWKNFEDTVKRS